MRVLMFAASLSMLPLIASAASENADDRDWPDRLVGHGGPVKAVSVSAEGREALTASFDYSIILWDLNGDDGAVRKRLIGHDAAVNDVEFVPGGKHAVSVGDDGAFAIWDLATGEPAAMIEDTGDKVLDVAVSLDGRFAAAARWDGTARVYDIAAGVEIGRADGHRGNVNAVAFSLDGRKLFTASYDGTVMAWPLDGGDITGEGRLLLAHGWGVNVIAPLPGASLLAFGSLDGTVGVIDLRSDETTVLNDGEHPVLSMAVSQRAGTLAAGTADGHILVFDTDSGNLIEDYSDGYGPIWGLSFVPDGDRLYRAGLDDFAIGWQVRPRKPFEKSQSVYPRRFEARDVDDPGELEFLRKCSVCHTLTPDDRNRAGPTLYGVFGRKAGTVEGYAYSDALANSDIVWNADTISRLFDDGPDVVTPGTKMPVQRLKSVERRDSLVRFLEEATRPNGNNPTPGVRG
jgi:cytochrome c